MEMPKIEVIVKCGDHGVIECRQCFPSPSENYRPEAKFCKAHHIAGCTECWRNFR